MIQLSKLYGVSADWILFGDETNEAKEISLALSSLELANFFSKINEVWEQGDEKIKNWVTVQLEMAFPKIAEKIGKEARNSSI